MVVATYLQWVSNRRILQLSRWHSFIVTCLFVIAGCLIITGVFATKS